MNNKKSSLLFLPVLVVVVFIVLINLYIVLTIKNAPLNYPIGQRQFELLGTAIKAEKALFYIDQSAKYSLQQSVYDLAQNGGISDIEVSDTEIFAKYGCERFNGAYVWYQLEKTDSGYIKNSCLDDNTVNNNLIYSFNKNLNQYLMNYPGSIPTGNYNYELKNSLEIIGAATNPLKFDIFKDESIQEEKAAKQLKDPQQIIKDTTKTPEGTRDFTNTPLCAKGSACVLTEEAFQMIVKAQENAIKKGALIEVYSAYRSPEQQKALWEGKTPEKYAQRYPDVNERRKYVSDPSNCVIGCPHLSSKAVDVRLKGKTTQTMTRQDWRLLQEIMTSKDEDNKPLWVKYTEENWHFECCGTDRYVRAITRGVTEIV